MLYEEKFVLHQRKLSDFSERQQGDYMTLRNSSPIPKEPRNLCLKIEPPAEILLRALKIYSVIESESDYKGYILRMLPSPHSKQDPSYHTTGL